VPAMVTEAPTGPELGDRLVMFGTVPGTVNSTPLLAHPETVTTTLPFVAPVGTRALTRLPDQYVGVAAVPLNATVLAPASIRRYCL